MYTTSEINFFVDDKNKLEVTYDRASTCFEIKAQLDENGHASARIYFENVDPDTLIEQLKEARIAGELKLSGEI